jgi:hypothetical protein
MTGLMKAIHDLSGFIDTGEFYHKNLNCQLPKKHLVG